MEHKTPAKQRARALAYYYANREKVRVYLEQYRRAHGALPRKPRMTREERLAKVRFCKCGKRITTPSLLLRCQNPCLICKRNTPTGKRTKAKENRKWRLSPKSLARQVSAYKIQRGCQHCGGTFVAPELDFHHRDPSTKLFKISWGVYHVDMKTLWAEVAKCDVLCRACHDMTHAH